VGYCSLYKQSSRFCATQSQHISGCAPDGSSVNEDALGHALVGDDTPPHTMDIPPPPPPPHALVC
jgi:hypothetical protein